jgi:ParB family chromosome partitioning protein
MSEAQEKSAFWQRFDQLAGDRPIKQIEKDAGLGSGTLGKLRAANTTPGALATIEAVAKFFGVAPAQLIPELGGVPAADPSLRRIPLDCIFASHLNPRRSFDDAELAELADSIAAQGLLQNIVVRQDKDQPALFWVVAGERRSRALRLLEADGRLPEDLATLGIPCRVITIDDEEHVALALLENLQRVDVNPMEEAEALDRLHRANPERWSTKMLAERLGKTQRFIQYRLALASKLPDEAKDALRGGKITMEQARVICAAPEDEKAGVVSLALTRNVPAPSLVNQIAHSFFPASCALFDTKGTKLETWTDPNTEEVYYTDFDAAMKLQEDALNARQQEFLDKGAEFVDVVEWMRGADYAQGGTGVVIEFDNDSYEVTIHENLKRAVETPEPAGATKTQTVSQWEIEARYRQDYAKAGCTLVEKIAKVLTPTDAIALLLFDRCVPMAQRALSPNVASKEGPEQKELFNAVRSFKPGDIEAWKHVRNADLQLLDKAFSQAVGGMLYVSERGALSPAITSLAHRNKIAIPAILRHTPKQRAEAMKRIEEELAGQTDLEDAIAATDGETEAEDA